MSALARFAAKCRFDPVTGCVLWTGGTTSGQGKTQLYGRFWYGGCAWLAHRWAAVHIHGIPLGDLQAAHVCPAGSNTLCVEHIAGQTNAENIAEQFQRLGNPAHRATQTAREKQFWLFVEKRIEELRPILRDAFDVPFYDPPAWLQPYLPKLESNDDCPF